MAILSLIKLYFHCSFIISDIIEAGIHSASVNCPIGLDEQNCSEVNLCNRSVLHSVRNVNNVLDSIQFYLNMYVALFM
jgi:hypothetical protein